jgi:hypothetical protein
MARELQGLFARRSIMRIVTVVSLFGLCLGCAQPLIIVVPGVAPREARNAISAERLPDGCPYTRMAITHSRTGSSISNADLHVSSKIAELMRREFVNSGATITDRPADAYWSLMVMAVADDRHYEGFIFSASIGLRALQEGHDPGITSYKASTSGESPIIYSGLGFGPGYVLEETVREFVRRADTALLPAAQRLCAYAEAENFRESELEARLPVPL